jgi:hypothetical protein
MALPRTIEISSKLPYGTAQSGIDLGANHDAAWLGEALVQGALIYHVMLVCGCVGVSKKNRSISLKVSGPSATTARAVVLRPSSAN